MLDTAPRFRDGYGPALPLALFFYGTIVLGALEVITAPLDYFSGYALEGRYDPGRQSMRSWSSDWLKVAAVERCLGIGILEVVYALIALEPDRWWRLAGAIVTFIMIVPGREPSAPDRRSGAAFAPVDRETCRHGEAVGGTAINGLGADRQGPCDGR